MGVLVGWILIESGEGGGGDHNFNATALLACKLCFDLLVPGDQEFTAQVSTCWLGSTHNNNGSIQLRGGGSGLPSMYNG